MGPFFIVGNDRSGTTLLRIMLDRTSQAAVPTESMIVTDFASIRRRRDLSKPGELQRLLQRVWRHPKVRQWRLPDPPPLPPAGLSHRDAYRFAMEAPFLAYARRYGKECWGDKTPAYLAQVDDLLDTWPDAKVIVMVRDGRDVCLSVLPLPFGANNSLVAARAWAEGIRAGVSARQRHPTSILLVRYEDLVEKPGVEVRKICAFLGLEFSKDMLRIEATKADKLVASQAGWFSKIWEGVNTGSTMRWRREMSPKQQAIFASVARAELALCGYETPSTPVAPVPRARALVYVVHDALWRLKNFVILRIWQERGREVPYVLRRKFRLL